MCFGSLKESSHRDGSFEYPQHVVIVVINKKNGYAFFILLDIEFIMLINVKMPIIVFI